MNDRAKSVETSRPDSVQSIELKLLVQLFDNAPDVAFFVKDALGKYLAVNDSLVNRHGLSTKQEAIGKCPCDICPGEFGRVPTEQDTRVLETGLPLVDHLEMQWHKPNQPVWCLTTKLPILDPTGHIKGLIGFSRDVRLQVESHEIPEELANSLDYFESHLQELDSPSALAKRSNITLQRLTRLTKRLFGLTPGQLITKIRIAAASRMLMDSQTPIADVAIACGYYDQSAFTRTFRSATGVTPSEFRKHSQAVLEC